MNKQMAVTLAKDVLLHLDKYRTVGFSGYCSGDIPDDLNSKLNWNAQRFIAKIEKNCGVCALGSMFLSYIRKLDDVKVKDLTLQYNHHSKPIFRVERKGVLDFKLREIFSEKQLLMIESAFERRSMCSNAPDNYDNSDWSKGFGYDRVPNYIAEAINFGREFVEAKDRLQAIMQNIIANNGEFVPTNKSENQTNSIKT
ncbi:hypothetical protein C4577_04945 [Candidatus Parcubacteria bacterium]|nr:MAG: hypothetical protein C4577_04945 [Candidatus Parcubacteria bacterium]